MKNQLMLTNSICSFAKLLPCCLLFACCLLLAPTAQAQVGLGDIGAASAINAELESGNVGRDSNKAEDDPFAGDAIEQEELPGGGEAAADAPKAVPKGVDQWDDEHSILRDPNASVFWPKLLGVVFLFLLWVRSADWVNRDAQLFDLGHEHWNIVMVIPFAIAFMISLLVPLYPAYMAILFLAWLVPFVMFALKHNGAVEPHEMVFTKDWFGYQLGQAGKMVGLKVGGPKQPGYMKGPPVDLVAMGGDERTNHANLITARQSPGYVLVKELIADMEARGSTRVMLDYTQEAVGYRHLIDGVWHPGEPRDRESGDVLLAVMKQLGNLNVSERRKIQQGKFAAEYEKKKFTCPIETQGTKTGERVIVSLQGGDQQELASFQQLGMREKLSTQWAEVMGLTTGVIVYSAPPEGGLTTLTDVGLLETDRLMRDFFSIEEASNPDRNIENIEQVFYDASKEESPVSIIRSVSLKYPDVYVCRDWVNPDSAKKFLEEVIDENRVWITSVNAKEAPEALLRVLQKKVPHKQFAESVVAVLNTRLIRTLCPACKFAYPAPPELLKKLGIPAGKVTTLYRPPKEDEIEKPCPKCTGIGFQGRTGLFELLVVNDQVREVLLKQPKLDILRKAARAAGMRTMQEEGILLIAKGETSLNELSRVLKS